MPRWLSIQQKWWVVAICIFAFFPASIGSAQQRIGTLSYYEGHAGLLIRPVSGGIDRQGCTRDDYYILPRAQAGYAETVSLLITAESTGRGVSIAANGCVEGFPRISSAVLSFSGQ